ncbi:hypothetical protein EA662_17835 [Pseudoxanthomonas winnipegensis]|nr:hypothetical protein EA662_17835 [Pseudoxanthomonas winnipegensis]
MGGAGLAGADGGGVGVWVVSVGGLRGGIRDSGFGIRDSGFGNRDSGIGNRESGIGNRESKRH